MKFAFSVRFLAIIFFLPALAAISSGQGFPGTGTGPIPDPSGCGPSPGTPLNVTFNVTGIPAPPSFVSLSVTFGSPNHTWMGDITATLIAPNGASHTIFGFTGSTTATGIGDSSDLGSTYVFNDLASNPPSGGWWQEAAIRAPFEIMTPGTYRTTGSGGAGQTNPAPPTNMNTAFASIPTSNGTWTLRLTDGCNADTGSVSAARLFFAATDSFPNAPNDIDGDGKTDFSVVRNTGIPANQATWFTSHSGGSGTTGKLWGIFTTDFFVIEDFTGDGKDDIAVWREAAAPNSFFYILDSSNNTMTTRELGFSGCDPTVVGDWDGDGKADAALYCGGTLSSPQSFFYYRGSLNPGIITFIPYGRNGDFPFAFDYDGDNKLDAAVQRNNGGAGNFYIRKSASGGATEFIPYGNASDLIVPGDYDGDGRDDICLARDSGSSFNFYIRESDGGGSPNSPIPFGLTATDFICQGDYDGDGKTDLGVWRSGTPATFFYQNSSMGNSVSLFSWGTTNDYPANGWNVH